MPDRYAKERFRSMLYKMHVGLTLTLFRQGYTLKDAAGIIIDSTPIRDHVANDTRILPQTQIEILMEASLFALDNDHDGLTAITLRMMAQSKHPEVKPVSSKVSSTGTYYIFKMYDFELMPRYYATHNPLNGDVVFLGARSRLSEVNAVCEHHDFKAKANSASLN